MSNVSTFIEERDGQGRISKLRTVNSNLTIWTDLYYNNEGNISYRRDTTVNENHEIIDIHEQWRDYHSNGELKEIRSNKGVTQRFDERGIPTILEHNILIFKQLHL